MGKVLTISEWIGFIIGKVSKVLLPKRTSVRLRRKLKAKQAEFIGRKMLNTMANREEERAKNMGISLNEMRKRMDSGTWIFRDWSLEELKKETYEK